MTDRRDDDDLAETVEELSTELRSLRDDLKRDAPRGPLGLPRPPSPREFLEFADEVAIPGTIAILEANIKLLETLQRAIRLADSGRRAREGAQDARSRASRSADRLASVSDDTLQRLEGSLSDLQTALESGPLPDDETARTLVEEARSLRDDVQRRLRESRARERDHTLDDFEERAERADRDRRADAAADETDRGSAGGDGAGDTDGSEGAVGTGGSSQSRGVEVDVDAELETLKDRYGNDDQRAAADDDGDSDGDEDATDGTDPDGDGASSGEDGSDRTDDGSDRTDDGSER